MSKTAKCAVDLAEPAIADGWSSRPERKALAATVHADSDVLLWLKGQGKGHQTRMNAIPRDAMLLSIHQ